MKRMLLTVVCAFICLSLCACEKPQNDEPFIPEFSQMKSICELATTECYYHNVAKFTDKDRTKFLWLKKDAHFWIEYSGKVTIGIDASELEIDVDGLDVTITLPEAEVLDVNVIESEKAHYIVAKDSAPIHAEDEINAITSAQSEMKESAKNNSMLLTTARENAKKLLGEYVKNVGKAFGKDYRITWIYVDEDGNTLQTVTEAADTEG